MEREEKIRNDKKIKRGRDKDYKEVEIRITVAASKDAMNNTLERDLKNHVCQNL